MNDRADTITRDAPGLSKTTSLTMLAIETLLGDAVVTKNTIRYSPVQATDKVLGPVSQDILGFAVWMFEKKVEFGQKDLGLRSETDKAARKATLRAIHLKDSELDLAKALFDFALKAELGKVEMGWTGADIVLRYDTKSKQVVGVHTALDQLAYDQAAAAMDLEIEASIERTAGGDSSACGCGAMHDDAHGSRTGRMSILSLVGGNIPPGLKALIERMTGRADHGH